MGESSQKEHIVLNQQNALNITFTGRKLLHQATMWHKIIIHNVATVEREHVLKTLLNAVHPLDLIPVNYKIEGNNAFFIARNCSQALEKLCRDNLVVHNPRGQTFILTVVLGHSNTSETQLNVQNNIADAIKKRHDPKTGTIDLDAFHKDPALNELIFCILSQPKILYFVLQLCKPLHPKILKLANNELRTISPLEILWSCKSLTSLDLRFNFIENMVGLSTLKSMQIKELWLDGNPVCQNYDENGYLQAVREICPTITKLDGVLLGSEGFLAYRRNYSIVHNSESFVDQFLEHFFNLYDNDRSCLQVLYHKNAIFSVSCSYIAGQSTSMSSRLDAYKRFSRNQLKLVDMSRSDEHLEVGPEKIIKRLCNFPRTEHDPYTFTVDVLEFSERRVTLTVTGAFREPAESLTDSELLFCFCRTFILVARENGEFNIVNEMFHVSNATSILAKKAFKMVKVNKPRVLTMLKNAQTDAEKDEFIFCMSKITALNNEWAKRCLNEAKWNLREALELFVDFYKLDKIPQDAFLSEEVLNKMTEIRYMNEIEQNYPSNIPKGISLKDWMSLTKKNKRLILQEQKEFMQLEEHMHKTLQSVDAPAPSPLPETSPMPVPTSSPAESQAVQLFASNQQPGDNLVHLSKTTRRTRRSHSAGIRKNRARHRAILGKIITGRGKFIW